MGSCRFPHPHKGSCATNRDVGQVESDDPVVGLFGLGGDGVEHARSEPLVASAPSRSVGHLVPAEALGVLPRTAGRESYEVSPIRAASNLVEPVAERFEAMVDRSGKHHVWLDATDASGTPQMHVDGRLTTARRVAWQLVHGPLPLGVTVAACVEPRCVRVEHLSLGRRASRERDVSAPTRKQARRGSGSLRETRSGVWALTVSTTAGNQPGLRMFRTVGGSRGDTASALAALVAEAGGPVNTFNTLIEAYLAHLQAEGRSATTLRRYHQLWRQWLAPTLASLPPGQLTSPDIERALNKMSTARQSTRSIHQAAVVMSGCLAWAKHRSLVQYNAATGMRLPDGSRLGTPRRR